MLIYMKHGINWKALIAHFINIFFNLEYKLDKDFRVLELNMFFVTATINHSNLAPMKAEIAY